MKTVMTQTYPQAPLRVVQGEPQQAVAKGYEANQRIVGEPEMHDTVHWMAGKDGPAEVHAPCPPPPGSQPPVMVLEHFVTDRREALNFFASTRSDGHEMSATIERDEKGLAHLLVTQRNEAGAATVDVELDRLDPHQEGQLGMLFSHDLRACSKVSVYRGVTLPGTQILLQQVDSESCIPEHASYLLADGVLRGEYVDFQRGEVRSQ